MGVASVTPLTFSFDPHSKVDSFLTLWYSLVQAILQLVSVFLREHSHQFLTCVRLRLRVPATVLSMSGGVLNLDLPPPSLLGEKTSGYLRSRQCKLVGRAGATRSILGKAHLLQTQANDQQLIRPKGDGRQTVPNLCRRADLFVILKESCVN